MKPLVPSLRDATDKRKEHAVTTLQGGDQLHLTAKLLGFPKGSVLPVYGYCALYDEQGQPYSVRAYVRPLSTDKPAVCFGEREAVRFRFDTQREQWFGSVLMYLTEIDLTDFADCLRLERLPDALSDLIYPTLPAEELRRAA